MSLSLSSCGTCFSMENVVGKKSKCNKNDNEYKWLTTWQEWFFHVDHDNNDGVADNHKNGVDDRNGVSTLMRTTKMAFWMKIMVNNNVFHINNENENYIQQWQQ